MAASRKVSTNIFANDWNRINVVELIFSLSLHPHLLRFRGPLEFGFVQAASPFRGIHLSQMEDLVHQRPNLAVSSEMLSVMKEDCACDCWEKGVPFIVGLKGMVP